MHSEAKKMQPVDQSGVRNLALYYTEGRGLSRLNEFSVEDAQAAAQYYIHSGPGEHHDFAHARWFGGSVAALGLVEGSAATADQLAHVFRQENPLTGEKLPNNGGRRASTIAIDWTFAAPKDLSILMMLGDEDRRAKLGALWDEAVMYAIEQAEQQTAVVRRGRDGVIHKRSDGWVAVLTDHATARPVDGQATPHLHRHVVIANIAHRAEDTAEGQRDAWTALDAKRIFDLQAAAGAIAEARLRELLEREWGLHFELEVRPNGRSLWRVVGIDAALRDRMSLRQKRIFDEMLNKGLDISDLAAHSKVQRATREQKGDCAGGIEETEWARQELESKGITFDQLLGRNQQARQQHEHGLADYAELVQILGPMPDDFGAAKDWRLAAARHLASQNSKGGRGSKSGPPPPPDFVRLDLALAAHQAQSPDPDELMLRVGRKHSTWRRQHLVAALADAGISTELIGPLVDDFLASDLVVQRWGLDDTLYPGDLVARTMDSPLYATAETLERERMILTAARDGQGAAAPLLDEAGLEAVLGRLADGPDGLVIDPESDQLEMLRVALTEGHRIVAISGQAGAGKSTAARGIGVTSDILVHAGEEAGLQVIGCALAANAALGLQAESGIQSYSIAMLTHRLATGQISLDDGAVIVVDEASQASTEQLAFLWEKLDGVNGRLILVGDERQLGSVEAGGLFRDLQKVAPQASVRLDEVRRQVDPAERVVLAVIHDRGSLSEASKAALRKQAARLEPHRNRTGQIIATPNKILEAEAAQRVAVIEALIERADAEGYDFVLAWYQEQGRIHVHTDAVGRDRAMAAAYWDALESANEADREKAAVLMAQTNEEARALNEAVRQEGLRRGHLSDERRVEFAGRDFYLGELVVGRVVARDLDVLNGQTGRVAGVRREAAGWELTVVGPDGRERKRQVKRNYQQGDSYEQYLSPVQVRKTRLDAERTLTTARRFASNASRPDAMRKAKKAVRQAEQGMAWARSLPDEGARVTMEVLGSRVTRTEDRLVVSRLDGSEVTLNENYAEHHLEGGAALTDQRAQGKTVSTGIGTHLGYVAASRGKQDNQIHVIVDSSQLEEEAERQRLFLDLLKSELGQHSVVVDKLEARLLAQGKAANIVTAELPGGTLTMAADANIARDQAARILAKSWERATSDVAAETVIGVAKRTDMAVDLNELVIGKLHDAEVLGEIRMIDQRSWAAKMPVVVASPSRRLGVEANDSGWIRDFDRETGGLVVEFDDGRVVNFSVKDVGAHLDQGFVLTAARARNADVGAEHYVAIGVGLTEEDLAGLRATGPTDLVVEAPELALERNRQALLEQTLRDQITRDAGTSKLTAHQTVWQLMDQEDPRLVGLPSLQEERRLLVQTLDRTRTVDDATLARNQITDQLIQMRQYRRERAEAEAPGAASPEELALLDSQIEKEMQRLDLVTKDIPLADPQLEAERVVERAAVLSEARSAQDRLFGATEERLNEVDAKMSRWTEIVAAEAIRNPGPYLPERPVGDPTAVKEWEHQVAQIEAFRIRWHITTQESPLGPPPRSGGAFEKEWLELTLKLGRTEDLALYCGLSEAQVIDITGAPQTGTQPTQRSEDQEKEELARQLNSLMEQAQDDPAKAQETAERLAQVKARMHERDIARHRQHRQERAAFRGRGQDLGLAIVA